MRKGIKIIPTYNLYKILKNGHLMHITSIHSVNGIKDARDMLEFIRGHKIDNIKYKITGL